MAGLALVVCLVFLTGCELPDVGIIPPVVEVPLGTPVIFSTYPPRDVMWSLSGDIGYLSKDHGATTQFNPTNPGTGYIRACSSDGKVCVKATIVVTYTQIPTKMIIEQPSGWSVKHGDTMTLSAKLLDQFDSEISSLSSTWAITIGAGSFSPNPGSSTTFIAGDPGSSPVLADITASYNSLTSDPCSGTISRQLPVLSYIQVSPSSPWTVLLSKPLAAYAQCYDQYGCLIITNQPTWSCSPPNLGFFVPVTSMSAVFFPLAPGFGIGTINTSGMVYSFSITVLNQ